MSRIKDRSDKIFLSKETEPIRTVTFLGPKIRGIFGPGILAAMEANGIVVNSTERLNAQLVRADRILMIGPMQHLTEQLKSLAEFRDSLPPVRVWFTEQIPNPALPTFGAKYLSYLREQLDRNKLGYRLPGTRFRVVGEMLALSNIAHDLKIHTFSDTNTIFFHKLGLPVDTLPIGTHKVFGQRSDIPFTERQVQVLFLGDTTDKRRGPIIQKLREELENRNIRLEVRSKQNPIHSDARTALLRKTRILLAVGRRSYDDQHIRLIFGGTNGNLVIAEEMLTTSRGAFIPGVHHLEFPIESLPDAVQYYDNHPAEAELITDTLNRKVDETKLSDQIDNILR